MIEAGLRCQANGHVRALMDDFPERALLWVHWVVVIAQTHHYWITPGGKNLEILVRVPERNPKAFSAVIT